MNCTIKVATWNLCLGLLHKKDFVKNLLHSYQIDVLNLQETETPCFMNAEILQIPNYVLEIETNTDKRRVATYISKKLK